MKQGLKIEPGLLPPLAAFECVARHSSFSRAAAELGLSVSALSQSVRALEARLGVRLLARTTRRVGLTEEGARLLEGVRRGLGEFGMALDGLTVGGAPRGMVRITVTRVLYRYLFAPHLAEFSARFPGVGLEFSLDDSLTDIVAAGFDAGVRIGGSVPADMVAVSIGGPGRLVTVATPAYFARRPPPRTLQDLAAHDCSRFRYASSGRIAPWYFQHEGDALEVDVEGRFIVNDIDAELDLVYRDLVLAQTPETMIVGDLRSGKLVAVLDAHAPTYPAPQLYFPSTRHMPMRLRAFIDFFQTANQPAAAT